MRLTAVLRQQGATNKSSATVTSIIFSFGRPNSGEQLQIFCTLVPSSATVQGRRFSNALPNAKLMDVTSHFKMNFRTLFMTGIVSFLFGCKDKPQNTVTETFQVDGDTITTKSAISDNPLDANYQLADLTPEMKTHIAEKVRQADTLIRKYYGHSTSSSYEANVLDEVFDKWRLSQVSDKETPEYVVEALGAAFGQDIVNSLECEWQVLTDQYGSDLTVIHKKYNVNGFPFSTAEKAFTENKVGSFETIKLTMKHEIERAKTSSEVQERH